MSYSDFHTKYPELVPKDFWFETPPGWEDLIDELCQKLYALDTPGNIVLAQVKSKFGLLRVYFDCEDEFVYRKAQDIVHDYEMQSAKVCHVCGAPGFLANPKRSWVMDATCSLHRND